MQTEKPILKVLYNGKDITEDISRDLMSFNYTDRLEEADTLDIEVEDIDGLWNLEWYPEKGAKITAQVGIAGGSSMNCGTFEIDEIELRGAPDTVNIRCIAAGFKEGQKRTNKSHVHENKTLREVINTVAGNLGLRVQGSIEAVKIGRLVQNQDSSLSFLAKLAKDYGYTFSVKDKTLVFIKKTELTQSKSVKTYERKDLISYSFKDKSTGTYKHAKISYHNPENGELITHQEADEDIRDTDDVLVLKLTAENETQAKEMTRAALREANQLQQSGTITLPGSPFALSGNVISLKGLGRLSGDFIIHSASHTISNADGWLADLEIYKINYKFETETKKETKKENEDTRKMDFFGDL